MCLQIERHIMAKAPVKPKALKKLNVPVAPDADEAAGSEKSAVIILEVPGDAVALYNDADSQVKAWEKEKTDKRPSVSAAGVGELYRHNCAAPAKAVKTVRVVDSTGAACTVTISDTYGKAQLDPVVLTQKLANLGKADINAFVAEKLVLGFDSSVFYDEAGNLLVDAYIDFLETTAAFAARYGLKNPFSSKKVVSPLDGFAETRWSEFKVEQQPVVTQIFPATVTLKPVAEVKKPE